MKLEKCAFANSHTDEKTGKMEMPERCVKKKCSGYDNPDNPKCEFFLPLLEEEIIKEKKSD